MSLNPAYSQTQSKTGPLAGLLGTIAGGPVGGLIGSTVGNFIGNLFYDKSQYGIRDQARTLKNVDERAVLYLQFIRTLSETGSDTPWNRFNQFYENFANEIPNMSYAVAKAWNDQLDSYNNPSGYNRFKVNLSKYPPQDTAIATLAPVKPDGSFNFLGIAIIGGAILLFMKMKK